MSGDNGVKAFRSISLLLIVAGIVTLVFGLIGLSNSKKTNKTMGQLKTYYEQMESSSGGNEYGYSTPRTNSASDSRSAMFKTFDEWYGKSTTYSYAILALSVIHIVAGILGIILAESSGSGAKIAIGAVLVAGAIGVIVYPMMVNRKDYDEIEAAFNLMSELFKTFGKALGGSGLPSDMEFNMVALKPFSQIITYTGLILGLGYFGSAFLTGGSSSTVSSSSSGSGMGTVNTDDFFAQFNKPPVPPQGAPQQQRPMGAPQGMPQQQRPMGAPQGMPQQQRPMGAPQGMPQQQRPMGAPQGMPQQQRPMGAPQGAPQQPRPMGAPQGMPQQQRPMGAPQGAPQQPRPMGAPQGMPQQQRPMGSPQGMPQQQFRPSPNAAPQNLRPAPGVRPPAPQPPQPPQDPAGSGTMDEVALPSAEDLERLLGGMNGQK
ncbi:hypothetical protein [Ruminococcus sp. FC2018]|uniref:hypothetical protein n=1 Tax=Ruminococcus sp. FC2018 TaxID=1410617 RepID=UPI00048B8012|nr:hypothetical protein [Ruminococcus sp. FC2018]